MIAKSRSRQRRAAKTARSTDIEDRFRQRAYQLYEQRGTVDGFALDDWLQAEARGITPAGDGNHCRKG